MSNCTSPIDITNDSNSTCLLKCLYFYKYGNSSATISNEENYLSISYDGTSDVLYNSSSYTPTKLLLFKPSIHTYNGARADAEVIAVHTSNSGKGDLYVSVPISTTGSSTLSSGGQIIEQIINNSPQQLSSVVGGSTVNITNYNLQFIIPQAPYYSYKGSSPLHFPPDEGSCISNINFIVFNKSDTTIAISSSVMDKLGSLISSNSPTLYAKGTSFYNKTGTTSNGFGGDGQIYIDCQPTDDQGEILYQADESGSPIDEDKIENTTNQAIELIKQFAMIFIGFFIFIIFCWLPATKVFKKNKKKIENPESIQ